MRSALQTVLDTDSEAYTQLQDIKYSSSPLYTAGYRGHMALATVLLSAGLPVDMTDSSGDTLLQGAVLGGQDALVSS
ncbi:hypothetical protein PR048_033036 [Dryococelus australis]|uniref:Uncharacterized protein n=1 Tax=Dryococelus australis TaxID=614101 RepID=A0ABQ9G3X9_9NEOP|nr:hypothetical protein PR048_033036 [Dryococelus australis]